LIYRITTIDKSDNSIMSCVGADNLLSLVGLGRWKMKEEDVWDVSERMTELGMKSPKKKINNRARFYFTERGWEKVGRIIMKEMNENGFHVRVEKRKNPKASNVTYADSYQVALLPNKRK